MTVTLKKQKVYKENETTLNENPTGYEKKIKKLLARSFSMFCNPIQEPVPTQGTGETQLT